MEITTKQTNLLRGLKIAGRLSSSRSSLVILSNVLLSASDSEITLTATDLEAAITYKVPGKILKPGSVTIPAKLALDLVSSINDDNISLISIENKIKVSTEKVNSTINGISSEEFPVIPKIEGVDKFAVSGALFREAITQVVGSVSKDDTRPVLNGVYIYQKTSTECVFVATDSYRLSEKIINAKLPEGFSVILPYQAAQELSFMLEGVEFVNVVHAEGQIQFETDDATLVSKTISGKYPDYKSLIPNSSDIKLKLNNTELSGAVKTAGLFARDIGGSIQFSAESGVLNVRSTGTQLGENNVVVDSSVDGEGDVSFNSRYMSEALSNIDDQDIMVGFSSSISPIVVSSATKKELTQLIMPLKT